MAVQQRYSGANLYVEFIGTAGTANLTGDLKSFSMTREQETWDATAGADGARVMKPTVKKFSASLEFFSTGTAGSAAMAIAHLGAEGTVRYYPQGTATNSPIGEFPAIIVGQNMDLSFDDGVVVNFEFEGQGMETKNPLVDVVA